MYPAPPDQDFMHGTVPGVSIPAHPRIVLEENLRANGLHSMKVEMSMSREAVVSVKRDAQQPSVSVPVSLRGSIQAKNCSFHQIEPKHGMSRPDGTRDPIKC